MIRKRSIVINERITLRTSQAFKIYLNEVNNYDLLSEEEEEHYGTLAFNGDKEAINMLITSNLRFVVSVAKQFTNSGEELQDLVNEGNMGLHIAAQRYDPDKGFKFLTFAVWWIRHKINEYLSGDGRLVKLPLNKINEANEINKIINKLKQKLERSPSSSEVLAEMGISFSKNVDGKTKYDHKKLEKILTLNSNNSLSLDRKVSDSESSSPTMLDLMESSSKMSSDAKIVKEDRKILVEDILRHLPVQQQTVLKMLYGIGYEQDMTLKKIGDEMNLSRERVRQIRENGLNKLKTVIKNKNFSLN